MPADDSACMDPLQATGVGHDVFLTRDAIALGHDERSIARAVRSGLWHRVRRGAFVPGPTWHAAGPEERHLITAAAIHRSYGECVAFSHVTAALMHGIAVWGIDLSRVHVTRLDGGAGRTERDLVHHEGLCLGPADIVDLGGRLLTAPARAALETGILGDTERALVPLDSALNLEQSSPTSVGNAYDVIQHWPGAQHLQIAVRMADGRAQSAGETRSRWLFFSQGLPAPDLQFQVIDAYGNLIGITDFAWHRHRTLGEFDGLRKYERPYDPRQEPVDVVIREKRREDELRRTTRYGMVRLIWVDLDHPVRTANRVRSYLDAAA